jgi:hypothetical protein
MSNVEVIFYDKFIVIGMENAKTEQKKEETLILSFGRRGRQSYDYARILPNVTTFDIKMAS